MAVLEGDNLIISKAEGSPIAASKSCEVNMQCDLKEVSSPASGQYRQYVAGRKTWMISCAFLVPVDATVKNRLMTVGNTYTLTLGVAGSGADRLTGQAICTECKITASTDALIQGSFSFQGSGPLE